MQVSLRISKGKKLLRSDVSYQTVRIIKYPQQEPASLYLLQLLKFLHGRSRTNVIMKELAMQLKLIVVKLKRREPTIKANPNTAEVN